MVDETGENTSNQLTVFVPYWLSTSDHPHLLTRLITCFSDRLLESVMGKQKADRNKAMLEMRLQRKSYQEIADHFGLSKQQVYNIIMKFGAPRQSDVKEGEIQMVYNVLLFYAEQDKGTPFQEDVSKLTGISLNSIPVYYKILESRGYIKWQREKGQIVILNYEYK